MRNAVHAPPAFSKDDGVSPGLLGKIEHLESEIHGLREDLVSVAPEDFSEIIAPWEIPSDFNLFRWTEQGAAKIIEKTELAYPADRAPCPLCNSHPEQHAGVALPNGLERHLTGSLGHRQCVVMKAARVLLREQFDGKRSQAENPP